MVKITYHGHACIELNDGKYDIIFDPFITGNPVAKISPEKISPNAILVSHGHPDHLGDAVEISKRTGATIIAPFELATFCGERGAKNIHPMHIGGSHLFDFGYVKLTLALHGSAFISEKERVYTGNPCGFIVKFGGKTIYFAGDTGLFTDMKMLGELFDIDVAFLPIGDNFTMGISDAAKAATWLKTKIAIPIHYNTWDVINQDPLNFVKALEGTGVKAIVVPFNDSYTINGKL